MAQHPFLKSIKPVNLLSFGPNTEEIELRPLNILIGPNGSGKSNLLEILRLLYLLPEKEPWSVILRTGGVDEWIWKGNNAPNTRSVIEAKVGWEVPRNDKFQNEPCVYKYKIGLDKFQNSFRISSESLRMAKRADDYHLQNSEFIRNGAAGELHLRIGSSNGLPVFDLAPDQSILYQISSRPLAELGIGTRLPEILEIRDFFDSFDFHQDWEIGPDLSPRDPVPVGQSTERLEENAANLAQMLKFYKDYHRSAFEKVEELMGKFYEPLKALDVRLIGTHLQVAIEEKDGFSTSAYRLSDGSLRWLALLVILLNPTPAPLTCIEEPELGLHPDIIPTLADLLRDASTRTQLILTTHSQALVECFSDNPEAVCVCEKVEGATQIRRLDRERLSSWLEDYSLGQLWAKGEIGGNRW
ncbi:MAG: AAA family ATPase [Acidobacteriota bacterium]